jgi:hypothetical protein
MNAGLKQLKSLVKRKLEAAGIHDEVRIVKGVVAVRHTYFYRHGMDATKYATRVAEALGTRHFACEGQDEWRSWPKESYFQATVHPQAPVLDILLAERDALADKVLYGVVHD